MATLKELEGRIKQLEAEVLMQKKMIKETLDLVQRAIDEQFEKRNTYYKDRKADEQKRLEEPEEKKEKALLEKMKGLGYKPIKSKL